jgi:hypothetical protein
LNLKGGGVGSFLSVIVEDTDDLSV